MYGTPAPEDLAAAALSDETLVAEDDGLVLTDEPGLGTTDDEPLVAPGSDDELAETSAYSLEDESLADEATATSMEALSLGDEDEPPPTMIFTGPVSTTHLPLRGSAASVWK